MKRLREEVDGLHACETVAETNERARIARERRRIARNVDDACRPEGGERGVDPHAVRGGIHLREDVGGDLEVEPSLERDADGGIAGDEPDAAAGEDDAAYGGRARADALARREVGRSRTRPRACRERDA